MATDTQTQARKSFVPPFENGERMKQPEFHRLYEQTPPGFKAELIGGVVHMPSPLKLSHGVSHPILTTAFVYYMGRTPGVQVGDNATVVIGEDDEPQPDLFLRVRPEYGGQSATTADDYVEGAPELIAEVAGSSGSIDLHRKRERYEAAGVREYLVLNLRDRRLHAFDTAAGRSSVTAAEDVYGSFMFPGLWIAVGALLTEDVQTLLATLDAGLATSEHAAFVAKLAATKKP